jgi:hypothetical protein
MRTAHSLVSRVFLTAAAILSTQVVFGQGIANPAPSGINAAFTRLFGDIKAFSAEAAVTVHDKTDKELVSTPMTFHVSGTKIRMDVDMSRLKSKDLPPGAAEGLKQMGMDKVVTLVLPEKKSSYLVYHGLKAYLQTPLKDEDQITSSSNFKMEREKLGTETVSGHPCVRNLVTVTDPSGKAQKATTWNATDLRDFPVQIQMNDGENLMTMRFSEVKLVEPKAETFALPAGYTAYDSPQDMMQGVMAKAMQGLQGLGGQ